MINWFLGLFIIVVVLSIPVIYGMIAFFKEDKILQNGVLVEGCIIEHSERDWYIPTPRGDLGGDHSYYLKYRYEYQGRFFTQKKSVRKKTYFAYPDGAKISVRCMPDDPTRGASADL
jgi:hypothetical protein